MSPPFSGESDARTKKRIGTQKEGREKRRVKKSIRGKGDPAKKTIKTAYRRRRDWEHVE